MALNTTTYLPTDASFVVLSLDPVATVAHLNNKTLTAACELLPRKKYIAYIGEGSHTFRPWMPYNRWPFYLVFQGLRPANLNEGISPEMSVPIHPNTSHPSSRKPLDPGKPFPWQDCYISSFVAFEAQCATITTEQQPEYEASPEEAIRVEGMFERDIKRQLARIRARKSQSQSSPLGEISGDSAESLDHDTVFDADRLVQSPDSYSSMETLSRLSQLRVATSKLGDVSREALDECIESETDVLLSMSGMSSGRIDDDMIVVNASYDLASVDIVNDPDDFFKELEFFYGTRYNLMKSGPWGRVRRTVTASTMASRKSSKFFSKRVARFFQDIASGARMVLKQ